MADPQSNYGAVAAGAPGAKIDPYPTGGRQKNWRKPRLSDDQEHPVEVRKVEKED